MSLPPLPLIGGKLFIDNSGWVEGFSSCYRYLQYKCLNQRILAAEKPSLNFGSAMHLMEELRYLRYASARVDDNFLNEITPIFTEFFAQHPPASEDWRTLNWAIEVTKQYNSRYLAEEFDLLAWNEPIKCPYCKPDDETFCPWCLCTRKRDLMIEVTFALPLYTHVGVFPGESVDVIYTGRIDLPLSLDGHLWVMDHKHVGMLGQTFWDDQRMTAQHRGYCWAFQQLTGRPVRGYMVNAIRTKEPPLYVKEGTGRGKQSPANWWSESFQRERFYVDNWKIDEWKRNTIDLCEEFFWHYQRGFMPQKTKWCTMYGKCPYYQVCTVAPNDRGAILQSGEFATNDWSPLKQITQSKQ